MAIRVLIVDDSPAMRGFVQRVLEISGLETSAVLEAEDGVEALETLAREPVDVVLTDINMPRMDGEEFVRRLVQAGSCAVPVVVISTDATAARVQKLLSLGVSGYLAKPFTPEALREEMERVISDAPAGAKA